MSNEQSERALFILYQLGRSLAALSVIKTLKQFEACKRAGRNPDTCFLEAVMNIYTTPDIPGPPLPKPFHTIEELQETLRQAPALFREATKLAETYLAELDTIPSQQLASAPD